MKRLLTLIISFIAVLNCMSQTTYELNLYEGKVPHDNGDTAMVYVHLAPEQRATGRAVVICPGGAYAKLAMDHEGHDWVPFFHQQGISVIVLKYRLPHGDYRVPIEDAENAMKLVRSNAEAWNIKTDDIGIMGFSAGGHLASALATHCNAETAPNFQILFYPVITMDPGFTNKPTHDNLLGEKAKKKLELEYSNDMHVTRATSRAFICLSDDDTSVLPANGFNYYFELYRHDVPGSLHIYPTGGHGWGMRNTFAYHIEMLMDLKSWLQSF